MVVVYQPKGHTPLLGKLFLGLGGIMEAFFTAAVWLVFYLIAWAYCGFVLLFHYGDIATTPREWWKWLCTWLLMAPPVAPIVVLFTILQRWRSQ